MIERTLISGEWNDDANGWESDIIGSIDGKGWMEIDLPDKGRVVVKQLDDRGLWPKIFVSKWAGPKFHLGVSGETGHYLRVYTTSIPDRVEVFISIKEQ